MSLFSLPDPIFDPGASVVNGSAVPTQLANHIADILLAVAIPIAICAIFYSAYILMTGQGNPEAYNKVKKNLMYILTGVAIIVFAAFIFNFVAGFFR